MNRINPTAVDSTSPASRDASLATAEQRFRMIRRIKARVRAERALGLSDAQVLANTRAIQERELSKRLEQVRATGRVLAELAERASVEALAENRPAQAAKITSAAPAAPASFDRWLAETITKNRPFVPMTVVTGRTRPGA